MNKLTRADLYSLEKYSEIRNKFRTRVIEHKRNRRVELGENLVLLFEDRLIMQYQVQEMLKVEKIFSVEGIEEELEAYNPLIPDGSNWKATLMIQYPDENERKDMLQKLVGIEDMIWVCIEGHDKVFPVVDEDLERTTDEKTSSVHFMRYELSPSMVENTLKGMNVSIGVDHEFYTSTINTLPDNISKSLCDDLDRPSV